ncbi:hypothetical protein L0B53_18745 (plasmid) [Vibrio sp. SS-MA-C1-2]|uniref:hypothetical protein n=1 Tax=Vibrio sp. SS-MA-C1-2 TaxID=2908646 RepID=UPI001F1845D0|nr:hypothetical protein [Vibrio sp. SS-MA-C1-2]UJF20360.1 hypothetical protein L0B53_18745 [Vibrio sp. SS-MA-C1-2]
MQLNVQISSNYLPLMSFEKGSKVIETVIDNGLVIELAGDSPSAKKVYACSYKKRTNKPIKTVMEISSKSKLSNIDHNCEKVHVVFTMSKIYLNWLTLYTSG